MKKNLFVHCVFTLCFVLELSAKEVYSVDELIVQALKNSPDIAISKLEYEASQSRYDTAFSGYLPVLNLNGAAGRVAQDDTFNIQGVADNIIKGQLSLKQIIYDFGKTGGNSDVQKFASDAYSMQDFQNISNKKEAVKKAYYGVLKSLALINVQKENVKLNKAQLYRAQQYFKAGIRTKIDISDAEVQLIRAKLELNKAEYNLKLSYSNLDKIVGVSAIESDYGVYSQELELDRLYESLIPYELNLHDSILFAYENRYDLKQDRALTQSAQSSVRAVDSEYYPSFYFGANYVYQDAQSEALQTFLPKTQWSALLNVDWNLYQGGATSSRKEEQKINSAISNAKVQNRKLIIKANVTDAYINVDKSRDTVGLAQSLLSVSDEKFDQASKRYEHGLSDYIELQEARQGYINAKASLVVDYYDYYIAVAKLDNAIGK